MIGKIDYETAQATLRGNRNSNQDRSIVLTSPEGSVLLLLADGLGGHPGGEIAATILMETAKHLFVQTEKPIPDPDRFLSALLHAAHLDIVDYGQSQEPAMEPRTTAVAALVQHGRVYWAHVGDSRFYLLRQGKILSRTEDHSMVQRMQKQGLISWEEAGHHPQRNLVTRALGGRPSRVTVDHGPSAGLRNNDIILLCSDGLWGQIGHATLGRILGDTRTPLDRLTRILAHRAEAQAFPESDNVTVATLRWLGDDAEDADRLPTGEGDENAMPQEPPGYQQADDPYRPQNTDSPTSNRENDTR